MTNQNNELDELDEIVRRIHFSQASFNELTKEELYEDIGDDCLRVINKGKKAIQALYAPKPVENGELRDKAHKTLDVYLDGGGPYEFVIVNKDDYERTIEARLAERAKLKEVK